MNCESVTEQIRALAEGSLDDEQRIACKNHIETCQDCADALRGWRQAFNTLESSEAQIQHLAALDEGPAALRQLPPASLSQSSEAQLAA